MIFDLTNYGTKPVVIMELPGFIGNNAIAMGDLRGEHSLPSSLLPGETLVLQADLQRWGRPLISQNAPKDRRFRAIFVDAARKYQRSWWSRLTLGQLPDPEMLKQIECGSGIS
jgi:hypothetical protein